MVMSCWITGHMKIKVKKYKRHSGFRIVKRLDPEYKILERCTTTATGSKQKTQSGINTPRSESEPPSERKEFPSYLAYVD